MIDLISTPLVLDLARPVLHSVGYMAGHVPTASNGVFDLVTEKSNEAKQALRAVSSLVAVGFVLFAGIRVRGAIAGITVAAIAAALFLWFVFNITAVQGRVDNEINSLRSPAYVAGTIDGQADGQVDVVRSIGRSGQGA